MSAAEYTIGHLARETGCKVLRDNQGEKGATIRMRMAPGLTDEGRA